MADDEPDLTEAERRALQALSRESTPPSHLEDRVVKELYARGQLRGPGLRRRGRVARFSTAAAVFLAGLGAGAAASRWSGPSPEANAPSGSALFLLLLYDGSEPQTDGPGEEAARVAEYRAWATGLRRSGSLLGAEKLAPRARVLGGGGPLARSEEVLGYFLVRASSLDEALAIARGCPHLRHGGRVAVHAVAPT